MLTSDPRAEEGVNARRLRGHEFGPDITASFLQRNQLAWLLRSHEWCRTGFRSQHNGTCLTVFSAANYEGIDTNTGAVVVLTPPRPGESVPDSDGSTTVSGRTEMADSEVMEQVATEDCAAASPSPLPTQADQNGVGSTICAEAPATECPEQDTAEDCLEVGSIELQLVVERLPEVAQGTRRDAMETSTTQAGESEEAMETRMVEVAMAMDVEEVVEVAEVVEVVQPSVTAQEQPTDGDAPPAESVAGRQSVTLGLREGLATTAGATRLEMRVVIFAAAHYLTPSGGPSANIA